MRGGESTRRFQWGMGGTAVCRSILHLSLQIVLSACEVFLFVRPDDPGRSGEGGREEDGEVEDSDGQMGSQNLMEGRRRWARVGAGLVRTRRVQTREEEEGWHPEAGCGR